ncbi:hypothetical protein C4571_02065 [Candidatus Parcubacteria bacterium]|nr:MAG: hypothetical protein C4571_02065 [Candidatus Parcubacteria bacterium]
MTYEELKDCYLRAMAIGVMCHKRKEDKKFACPITFDRRPKCEGCRVPDAIRSVQGGEEE